VRRTKNISGRKGERGIVIMLVAVVMLFVVGAMAALAIDVVTLYTARSEAQLAADGAALAGARVLANSGLTSGADPIGAEALATTIATQVATHRNEVGGRTLNGAEVTVSFNDGDPSFKTNPHVTVQTKRTDMPTFFARIWGNSALTVAASATAEAYNPSGMAALGNPVIPVAPLCVKPWLLPNIDPTQALPAGPQIFNPNGSIVNPLLVGQGWRGPNPNGLSAVCEDCSPGGSGIPAPSPGQYYPAAIDPIDPLAFPAPTQALPACSAGFNPYQVAVAGCVPRPIGCGAIALPNTLINIDVNTYTPNTTGRNADTVLAASCLIHDKGTAGDADSIVGVPLPSAPFQFLAGNKSPIANAVGNDVLVSDSLVTIPVIDNPPGTPATTVNVIGFLQVFLNPTGASLATPQIPVTIINMAGCGNTTVAPPILGNGASPVAVRLISP
jgi:hypothetical protein